MKFTVQREDLLKSLTLVSNVVERRQTLAVVSNILFNVSGQSLSLTATDTEIEITSHLQLTAPASEDGAITVPAKKLFDICKSLADNTEINFTVTDQQKVLITCLRSRFTLATLPPDDFPNVDESAIKASVTVSQTQLKRLIENTDFAMAQQDVRFYLNGMLLELSNRQLRCVATDGHRLALSDLHDDAFQVDEKVQLIVPRKGIHELSRSLGALDEAVELIFGENHLTAKTANFTFITKLIDGKFPDYQRVLPLAGDNIVLGQRHELKEAFNRAAILSNDKYRGVRIELSPATLTIRANNPEQEEAEDIVAVEYQGQPLQIGFNVSYVIDVLNAIHGDTVKISLSDGNSSALIEDAADDKAAYVIMPMRL